MFNSTSNKGFQITFENGITISVQFGYGNYCDNYRKHDCVKAGFCSSNDAEIAIWDSANIWYEFDNGDTVKGRVSPDEVADWIIKAKRATDINSI